jgi:pyruvate ferredoxin oxidoreductase beta subunit
MPKLTTLSEKKELLVGGHRMCPGCAAPVIVRQILLTADTHLVVGAATGCLEVSTSVFPFTSWGCSWIHNAFENVASTISGVERAYKALKNRGRLDSDYRFIAFGGDGGTYDIGLQALSGALERGHTMLYVCYDNEAYMNTGIQRSSSTPFGADTTTSPAGKVIPGKREFPKDLTGIVAAHNVPYVAQASPSDWNDLMRKVAKALAADGPSFLNVISPCPPGWVYPQELSIKMARLAVETCFWPLYEVDRGVWKITRRPKEKKPLREWTKLQGRFRHLEEPKNKHILELAQAEVDRRWQVLQERAK